MQVISIELGGAISGLQVKKGKGLDLRTFGKASIRRYSEILWQENEQKWAIAIRANPHGSYYLSEFMFHEAMHPDQSNHEYSIDKMLFDEYEDAVEKEIAYYNSMKISRCTKSA